MKITEKPSFERDINFKELSPKQGKFSYRYVSTNEMLIRIPGLSDRVISFTDKYNHEWMRICPKGITISKEYAWNGCSPKRWIPVFGWVGTWDFEKSLLASFIHDALCQFFNCEYFPLVKYQVDNIFYDAMIIMGLGERIAGLYHYGVVAFGDYTDGDPSLGSKIIK